MDIAKQIAEALEAAHERGVIHRDLKPGNVMLTPDGKVKVLDFGLTKAFESAPGNSNVSNSPTMSMAATNAGVILGTAAYMSPEQAKGRSVDRRSDMFAFGCVLYEMLTGKRAFDGEDIPDTLSRVLQREPDYTLLPSTVPIPIRTLLQLCLEKNSRNRRSDASDVRIDVERAIKELESAETSVPGKVRRSRLGWFVATIMTLAFASVALLHFRERLPTIPPEMRVDIDTPNTTAPLQFALSPDGGSIVFAADTSQRLWLRRLDKTVAQPLQGTEGARDPFWSPDSRSIGFFASGKLKTVDTVGGLPQTLTSAPSSYGGTWNKEGTILFVPFGSTVSRISASGGEATPLLKLTQNQTGHRFPWFLPDGRHYLYYVQGRQETRGVYLGSLDSSEPKRLTTFADTPALSLPPDHILFARQGALVAWKIDLARGELVGEPETLANPVNSAMGSILGGFSASLDGRIAYRAGGVERRQLTWVDRTGKSLGVVGEPDPNNLVAPERSPDGRQVAVDRAGEGNSRDVWLIDVVRGGMTRFTFDPGVEGFPTWSPDGSRIAFESNRKGPLNIYIKPSNGGGTEEHLQDSADNQWPEDWSKDGRFLLYTDTNSKTGNDLWALPMTGNQKKVNSRSDPDYCGRSRESKTKSCDFATMILLNSACAGLSR